jgi:hypothetical protein
MVLVGVALLGLNTIASAQYANLSAGVVFNQDGLKPKQLNLSGAIPVYGANQFAGRYFVNLVPDFRVGFGSTSESRYEVVARGYRTNNTKYPEGFFVDAGAMLDRQVFAGSGSINTVHPVVGGGYNYNNAVFGGIRYNGGPEGFAEYNRTFRQIFLFGVQGRAGYLNKQVDRSLVFRIGINLTSIAGS